MAATRVRLVDLREACAASGLGTVPADIGGELIVA